MENIDMNTKQAEAELKKVEEQIEFITQRRAELTGKFEKLSQRIASLNDAIGEALLMNRDAAKEIAELQSKQTEAAMIENARNQANIQLKDLTMKRTDWQGGIARLEFDGIFKTFEEKLTDTIGHLYQCVSELEEIDKIRDALSGIHGISIDAATDEQQRLLIAHRSLKGQASGLHKSNLSFEIGQLEQSVPGLMTRIREKKSGR
jgi:chromosome segregation ATPase